MVRQLIHSLNLRAKKGFTLLEVLIAILLFSVGFISILQVMSAGLFAGGQNEDEIIAFYLAQEKIEEINNASFAGIAAEAKAAVTGFPAFSRQVAVSVPETNLDQITVTVYWYARNTETSFTMVTYVSNA